MKQRFIPLNFIDCSAIGPERSVLVKHEFYLFNYEYIKKVINLAIFFFNKTSISMIRSICFNLE